MTLSNRVLVVSPDPGLVQQVRGSLEGIAITDVASVANGEAALEHCNNQWPRLVIAEVDLPGITGQELCRRLKEEREFPPVVTLIHRHGDDGAEEQSLRAGADATAERPFQGLELVEQLRDVINSEAFNRPRPTLEFDQAGLDDSVGDESLGDGSLSFGEDMGDDVGVLDSLSIRPADTAEMEAVREQGDFEEVDAESGQASHAESSVMIASLPASDFEDAFLPPNDGDSGQVSGTPHTLQDMVRDHLRELTAEGSDFRNELRSIIRSTLRESLAEVAAGRGKSTDEPT